MSLTNNDFQNGQRLYRGKENENFYFDGRTILKLASGEFFVRTDHHTLSLVGFFPEVEVYRIKDKLVLLYLTNLSYTYIEPIKVMESKTVEPFDSFYPGKRFNLENGQVWQQVDGPNSPCSSSGYVKIVENKKIKVDGWDFYPKIMLIDGHL